MTWRQPRPRAIAAEGSRGEAGGTIPGTGDRAFTCSGPEPSSVPVLIAVPHAGRAYPAALLDRMRHPQLAALRLEDRHADKLAQHVAQACGARLLVAEAPRALIDLNRAPDDVDWAMFRGEAGPEPGAVNVSQRARNGLGLIPRRLPGLGDLWRGLHDRADLEARIAEVHAPYHAALAGELERLRSRWGAALLIDLHSMPPLTADGRTPPAEFVIGDRFGSSCAGELSAAAFHRLASDARRAAHNRPYAGGYVLERHGKPRGGIHALQIEVDRTSYLDAGLVEPGEGFADVATVLINLVFDLGEVTASLGNRHRSTGTGEPWTEAAE